MKELLDKFLMWFCFAGIGSIAVVAFVRVTLNKWKMKNVKCKIRKFILHSPFYILHFLIPILCVAGLIVYGSTKSNSPTNDPPAQTQMIVQPGQLVEQRFDKVVSEVVEGSPVQKVGEVALQSVELVEPPASNALVRVEKWWRRGAYNDGQILTFDQDWCFPYGTNHLMSVEVWASGAVYASMKAQSPIAELLTKLSLAPHDTEVFIGRTTNNTYRIEWRNGHPNRDASQTADASIELFRNGNVVVTEGGVETLIPYDIPFDYDGFGQDEDWARANFTNAEEIISIGYANWVDQQVGVGLTNGLYKFSAEFLQDPPEPTQLYIGDYSVCVTNAGVYTFVLEKGEEYEFGTRPFNDDVDYWAQDDLCADTPTLTAWCGGQDSPGEWTIDGGWNWFWRPDLFEWGYQNGYCCMMPTLQGSPAVTHLGPEDLPITFDAILSDAPQSCDVEYEWTADSECFDVITPRSKSTQIMAKALPMWDEATLSVSARFKNKSLTSTTAPFTYGTNAVPSVSISLDYPSVTFLNDDKRADRIYRLTAILHCDAITNGTFTISHSGNDNPCVSASTNLLGDVMRRHYSFVSNKTNATATNVFYVASRDVSHGEFIFTCSLASGERLIARKSYKVIEPLCRLVTTNKSHNGHIVNPSRLTFGTNAWVEVSARGDFTPDEVQWAITTNNCRCLGRRGYMLNIEPTVTSGVAVVTAKFNSDQHQPMFTMPIVMPRTIPVRAFIVNDGQNRPCASAGWVRQQIAEANHIFEQAGIRFNLISISNNVGRAGDYNLKEYDVVAGGSTNRMTISSQARALLDNYTGRDCIEVYYVKKILNNNANAFTTEWGIVMSSAGSSYILAHELGHALGAKDCYAQTELSNPVTEWFSRIIVNKTFFASRSRDWGTAEGRGFYARSELYGSIMRKMLMYGFDGNHQADIPDGSVFSLKKRATSQTDRFYSPVGALSFELKKGQEVFSK